MTRTPATCEDGDSGEVAQIPITYEDRLTSENFNKSSTCNSTVKKSMIAYLVSSELLGENHFEENELRNPTPEGRTISHNLFWTI